MKRASFIAFGSAALLMLGGDLAWAQEGWPSYGGDPLDRGPGGYLFWPKLLGYWLIFLMWVYSADWVSRDSVEIGDGIGMPHTIWNPIVVFSFLVAFMIVGTLIPVFVVSFLILLLAFFGPLLAYIFMRNSRVTADKKVLTPAHLKAWFSSLGKKKKKSTQLPYEQGAEVDITATAAPTDSENQSNLIAGRQSPGYITAKQLIAEALDRRADRVMLDYAAESVAVRYEIDGLWHNLEPREREDSDIMLAVMKKICNLNVADRRNKQEAEFKAKYKGEKFKIQLTTQGTQSGERAVVLLAGEGKNLQTLESLGMREKMREQLAEVLGASQGMIIFSAMPQGGLTSTISSALRSTDRMLRDFIAIEDAANSIPYVENLESKHYNAAAGETPDLHIPKLAMKQPDAFVVPDLPNAETVRLLCDQVLDEGRLAISTVRAKEAVEALLRVLLLKAPADRFAKSVTAVVNQRLVRRLCEKCKVGFEPNPQLLQRLGIPQGRVQALYQPSAPGDDPKEEICSDCGGLGYKGRIAIYELLLVDDQLRRAIVSQPKLEVLRQVARQAGNRTLQEEGILLVAQGITSLQELQRVLKV